MVRLLQEAGCQGGFFVVRDLLSWPNAHHRVSSRLSPLGGRPAKTLASEALKHDGLPFSNLAVGNHRQGDCYV